jgi:mono/diheme cytochrome c family protein
MLKGRWPRRGPHLIPKLQITRMRVYLLKVVVFAGALTLPLGLASAQQAKADANTETAFHETVRPFLTRNCLGCHNTKQKTANFDLQPFLKDPKAALGERDAWEMAARKIRAGEMPPPPLPRPPQEAVDKVTAWMEEQVARYDAHHIPDPGRVTARRLNRAEYNNTIRDLFGVDIRPADEFPVDDSGYGFDNIGDVLSISPVLMERYLKAAERIVQAALEIPRVPKTATSERFDPVTAPRAKELPADPEGDSLVVRGSVNILQEFPTEADYEIRYFVRRSDPELDGCGRLALFAGGQILDIVTVDSHDPRSRVFPLKARMPAGQQSFGAAWLESAFPYVYDNDGKPTRRTALTIEAVELRGPFNPAPPRLPESYHRVFVCRPEAGKDSGPCAEKILRGFATKAWRRPVSRQELAKLVAFVKMAEQHGDSFEAGIKTAVKAILVSPHFLFRIERDTVAKDGIRPLNSYELASRLSYFLWSSMPDEELFRLAAEDKLRDPAVLRAQVKRMLKDPKASALAENFAGQWLELRNLSAVQPDPQRFPQFDTELREAMAQETILFFDAVLREDRSILDFLDGRYTFLNERLARHYGIEGVKGREFRRVELDGRQRSGVLTQASVLTVTSYPTRTSPVLRGLWILENVLGTPPPPPPPNVPALEEREIGKNLSLRKQLELHRSDPACAVCHTKMDALGFGLENYDPIGAWRTADGNFPVDAAGELPGGKKFSSPAEMKKILLDEKDNFAHALTEKMLTYALGRGLERSDRPVIAAIARKLAAEDYRFSSMIQAIVASPPFLQRRVDDEPRQLATRRTTGGKE